MIGEALLILPTGSLISELGVPADAEERFYPDARRRADAWFWECGCAAEPHAPGKFTTATCVEHRAALERRAARKRLRHGTPGI